MRFGRGSVHIEKHVAHDQQNLTDAKVLLKKQS